MKSDDQKPEVIEEMFNPMNTAIHANPDNDRDGDEDEEVSEDENADWGDIDPNGGPAPSAPGSAV